MSDSDPPSSLRPPPPPFPPPPFVLGVVMLATNFPRLPGDIGNPESFAFETRYRRVPAATVSSVVTRDELAPAVADAILDAAIELEREGVGAITTSCGFLGALDKRLRAAVTVPLLSSALMLLPLLRGLYGERPIGILTFDSRALAPRHFGAHGDKGVVIEGLETGRELFPVISEDRTALNVERARADARETAKRLVARHPEVGALLLECTNLSPYRQDIAAATGKPVYDLVQALHWQALAQAPAPPAGVTP